MLSMCVRVLCVRFVVSPLTPCWNLFCFVCSRSQEAVKTATRLKAASCESGAFVWGERKYK